MDPLERPVRRTMTRRYLSNNDGPFAGTLLRVESFHLRHSGQFYTRFTWSKGASLGIGRSLVLTGF